jgi:hypothetical protein
MTCLFQISIILDFAALISVEMARRRDSWKIINSDHAAIWRIRLTSIVGVVAITSRIENTEFEMR